VTVKTIMRRPPLSICIPAASADGLAAETFGHFGSAPYFVIHDPETRRTTVIENANAHQNHGSCQPLRAFTGHDVDALLVGGIGTRAIEHLNAAGVTVYRAAAGTVGANLDKFASGQLEEITPGGGCAGHDGAAMTAADPTLDVIDSVLERLRVGGIDHVVVATTSGKTGIRFTEALADRDVHVVCVTHHVGFKGGDTDEVEPAHRERLTEFGAAVVTAGHALSGVPRSLSKTFGGSSPAEIVAHTLRLFGQGMKVCVEIAVMAADAGAIPTDRDVLCVGGTGHGADTAVVLKPAHMNAFLETRIREVLVFPDGR
jgi:predicted Fe-Mo cluster-binding NifX family protein